MHQSYVKLFVVQEKRSVDLHVFFFTSQNITVQLKDALERENFDNVDSLNLKKNPVLCTMRVFLQNITCTVANGNCGHTHIEKF